MKVGVATNKRTNTHVFFLDTLYIRLINVSTTIRYLYIVAKQLEKEKGKPKNKNH